MRPLTKAQLATLWNFVGEKPPKRAPKYDLAQFRVLLPGVTQAQAAVISAMAARGIREVCEFALARWRNKGPDTNSMEVVARRLVAIAWLLHSDFLRGEDGEVLTLTQLARLPQLKCTKVALSLSAKLFADRFKFHSRVQKRSGSKENYAAAAKSGWDKRRAREKAKQRTRKKT